MKTIIILFSLFISSSLLGQSFIGKDTLFAKKTDSITVVSKKPFIQISPDKTVMNMENRPASAGENAWEVFKSAHGIVIDPNDNIQMGGKTGVTVLIDGRNTQLDGTDLAQLLKSIESDNIRDIEFIRNPAAKYDAAGNAGIINIKLKKSITKGINGSLSGSVTQSTHARENGSLSVNAKMPKLNAYTNMSINNGLQYTQVTNKRITDTKEYHQEGKERDAFNSASIRTGVDYQLNKKSTIGIMWMYNSRYTGMDNTNKTLMQDPIAADTNVLNRSIAPFKNHRNNWNLNYRYIESAGKELTIDADYTLFQSGLNNTVFNEFQEQTGKIFANNVSENNAAIAISIKSVKIDYAYKLNEKNKLEIGAKSVFTQTENTLLVQQLTGSTWIKDIGRTNQFQFNEQIHAAYASVNHQAKKWQWQLGLRAEATRVKGISTDLKNQQSQKPDTSYLNLFPTILLQFNMNEENSLGLVYNKRIDRPGYQDQNPFVYVLDAFNSEQGNPYLLPEITHSVELSYTYQFAHALKLKYAETANFIEFLTYQDKNKTINIPQNAGARKMFHISLSTSFEPKKWWNIYASAEPFYQKFDFKLNGYGLQEQMMQSSWGFNGYINNGFSFTKGWKAELSAWFNYQNTTTIYRSKPFTSVNFGISKKVWNDKGTFKLAVSDLFNTQQWVQTAETSNLQMNTYRKWESRNISLGFSLRFGNSKIKSADNRNSGAQDEMNRIK